MLRLSSRPPTEMTKIKAFCAYRPAEDKVHLVASRSYVTYSKEGLYQKLKGNPYSYIHIINPEYDQEKRSEPFSDALFQKIRGRFESFLHEGIFEQDEQESFYLYRQEKETHVHSGIIALVPVQEYLDGNVLKHEDTIHRREDRFRRYLGVTGINAEPVLLAHREDHELHAIMQEVQQNRPEYNFTTADRINHKLWKISDPETLESIARTYAGIEKLYIADGHHRSASSALLHEHYRSEGMERPGVGYFMAMLMPQNELEIVDFNRVIHFEQKRSTEEVIQQISEHFLVDELHVDLYKPTRHGEIGMYLRGMWYRLEPLEREVNHDHPVKQLDAYVLSENLLKPIFEIEDLKTDRRVRFVSGLEGPEALKELVDSGKADVAFNLYPVSVEELEAVADAGMSMPPKSTWIEPKLRSGLTIYDFL